MFETSLLLTNNNRNPPILLHTHTHTYRQGPKVVDTRPTGPAGTMISPLGEQGSIEPTDDGTSWPEGSPVSCFDCIMFSFDDHINSNCKMVLSTKV